MRKILVIILFIVGACTSTEKKRSVASTSQLHQLLDSIVKDSIYNGAEPPANIEVAENSPYDPVVLAAQASLLSRIGLVKAPIFNEREKTKDGFKKVSLPASSHNPACGSAMPAYFRRSKSNPSGPTFVLLPGAFSSWKNGAFTHQTFEYLDKEFNKPNVLAFIGYLAGSALEGICNDVPWDGEAYARDLKARIQTFFKEQGLSSATAGAIGYSGGAYLASMLVGIDGESSKSNSLLGLGAMAFSPIIDGYTAFEILDAQMEKTDLPKDKSLLTFDYIAGSLFGKLINKLSRSKETMWTVALSDKKMFYDRFYNMFWGDLLTIVKSTRPSQSLDGIKGYLDVFINMGYRSTHPNLSESESIAQFKKFTNVPSTVEKAKSNLFIYTSQDDPVLSAAPGDPQAPAVTKALARMQRNKNIYVFNPKYGSHAGALLDVPNWEKLIRTFFGYQLKDIK